MFISLAVHTLPVVSEVNLDALGLRAPVFTGSALTRIVLRSTGVDSGFHILLCSLSAVSVWPGLVESMLLQNGRVKAETDYVS